MTNPQSPDPLLPTFRLQSVGIEATAQIREGKFVVLAGSGARAETVASFEGHSYAPQRAKLIEGGQLIPAGNGNLQYAVNVPFSKPSGAAAVTLGRSANGLTEWKLVTESGQQQTYGEWLGTTPISLPPELISPELEDFSATWKPLFHELARRLLDYQERQPELIDILRSAGIHIQHDEGEQLSVMDPFSFFSLILKHQSESRVAEILTRIKARLNLAEDVPTDLSGVPWSNPMNAWYFAYRSKRREEDLPTLWTLAQQAVAGRLEAETFGRALAIRKVALPKLTTGLFWLNPEQFLALNGVNVPYLERQNVSGAGKVQTLAEYWAVLDTARALTPDFATLSHTAWLATQTGKSVAALDGDAFPFAAFVQEAGQYVTDTPKGNMLLDRRYGQLLLSLIKDEDFAHLKPVRSPYSGKTQLAVKLGLMGGTGTDAGPFARAMLFATESYAEFITYPPGLTLETGVPDVHRDELRAALQNDAMREELLSALLDIPDLPGPPLLNLNSDFPAVGMIGLSGDGQAARRALDTYLTAEGKSCRMRVGITLDPDTLEGQDFLDALEAALTYVDGVLDALARVTEAAGARRQQQTQEVMTIEIAPAPAFMLPVDFVPIPGVSFNQILYGPPGTGKTYAVVNGALAVLDPAFLTAQASNRIALKTRYDQLVSEGQVSFVTFHQSFGYEDFIEGIKPVMSGGQLSYRLEDGVFLEAVRAAGGVLPRMDEEETAKLAPTPTRPPEINPVGQVWRIYIDGIVPFSQVRDKSLARGEIRVGSWLKNSVNQDGISLPASLAPRDLNSLPEDQVSVQQHAFKDGIRIGDLVFLASTTNRINAIGVVTGEYHFDPHSDAVFTLNLTLRATI
ncbi:DUF4357 domain-containing protein [Deinococcus marmoris]|uniref:DUF4357 domain-containing protein n=1 Tax=Deinococcus marmoris TaxID=249408 RepID=UPI00138DFD81|nr:DUF4357 domain-containing protein [Deinococcus marmoris]